MRTFYWLMALLLLGAVVAVAAGDKPKYAPPTRAEMEATRKEGRYLVTITMQNGKAIEVVLEGTEMPYTVANFVKLTKAKYYDGLTFHRVVEHFVIQGGDPEGTGLGGPGYTINLEISPLLRHKKGTISMARTDAPDTAGSQFFICTDDTPNLDGGYAAFGWVKSGMDEVAAVKKGDVMKTVTVAPYKGKEPIPNADENIK